MKFMTTVYLAICLLGLTACTIEPVTTTDAPPATDTPAQTGYPSGEIQRPYVCYNDIVYQYEFEGVDRPLPVSPISYEKVGTITDVDNINMPENDFSGARVEVGQSIFANEEDSFRIYLEYENGYAEFVAMEDSDSN